MNEKEIIDISADLEEKLDKLNSKVTIQHEEEEEVEEEEEEEEGEDKDEIELEERDEDDEAILGTEDEGKENEKVA